MSDSNAVLASQHLIDNINVQAMIGGVTSAETSVSQLFSRIEKVCVFVITLIFNYYYCTEMIKIDSTSCRIGNIESIYQSSHLSLPRQGGT